MASVPIKLKSCGMFRNTWLVSYYDLGSSAPKFSHLKHTPRYISFISPPCLKAVTINNMNSAIKKMEYAVRGPIVARAAEIEKELEKGVKKPYDKVIRANLGDAHAMGQMPITFIRQVLALMSHPELIWGKFPEDIKDRAKCILYSCRGGSAGAYTESAGIELIRKHIAEYIQARDGVPSDWENILLFDGASNAIKAVLKLLAEEIDGKKPGMMIPIPQYPLYTASIAELRMEPVGYYLDESHGWSLEMEELERAYEEGKKKCFPRAICVINPGNPTGQILTKENIQNIIKFSQKHELFIFADEVYEENVYEGEFHSFKKVMMQMEAPYNEVELASFLSASKGFAGECGLRGGCVEVVNMDADVKQMLMKSISAMLCPNVLGQTVMDCVYNPPKPGEHSYELFKTEKDEILKSFAIRAKMISEAFNSIPNMSCNKVQGAMYAFPKLELPEKVIAKANSQNICPSVLYCFELLEEKGICVVPGAGFHQQPGTYHFRTTILPQPKDLKVMLDKFKEFHLKFLERYS